MIRLMAEKVQKDLRKSRLPFWKYSGRSGKVLRKKHKSPEKRIKLNNLSSNDRIQESPGKSAVEI